MRNVEPNCSTRKSWTTVGNQPLGSMVSTLGANYVGRDSNSIIIIWGDDLMVGISRDASHLRVQELWVWGVISSIIAQMCLMPCQIRVQVELLIVVVSFFSPCNSHLHCSNVATPVQKAPFFCCSCRPPIFSSPKDCLVFCFLPNLPPDLVPPKSKKKPPNVMRLGLLKGSKKYQFP